jgi:hypothetical protein
MLIEWLKKILVEGEQENAEKLTVPITKKELKKRTYAINATKLPHHYAPAAEDIFVISTSTQLYQCFIHLIGQPEIHL